MLITMNVLVYTLSLVAAVLARPGGGGYEYTSPSINIGTPSGSYLPSSGHNLLSGVISQPSGSYLPGGGVGGGSFLQGGAVGNFGGHYQDQKHVYFYAAPDDEHHSRLRIYVAPSGQRNTKIIFVKAPSGGSVIPEVIAPPSHSEDKTLVYVLVKKQQQGGAITIPSSATVRQAKPQVYFIKYNSQHDATAAVNQGLGEQAVGQPLDDLNSAGNFVRSLGTSGFGGIGHGYSGGSQLLGGAIGGGGGYSSGGSGYSSGSQLLGGAIGGVNGIGHSGGRYADGADGYHY